MRAFALGELLLFAGIVFVLVGGLVTSLAIPSVVAAVRDWSPERRHRALFLTALSPVLWAAAALGAVLLPSMASLVWPELDHCLAHGDHHAHLCFIHLPSHSAKWTLWLVLLPVLAWVGALGLVFARRLVIASRHASLLVRAGHIDASLQALVVPANAPMALIVGILRPVVVVSEGLRAMLGEEQMAIVIAHERAHAARRDTLTSTVARVTTMLMLPGRRMVLLRALEIAAEQSCDEVAASFDRDRISVAETILNVENLVGAATASLRPVVASFGGDAVPERVTALLAPRKRSGTNRAPLAVVALVVVGVLASSPQLHHATESLLDVFVH